MFDRIRKETTAHKILIIIFVLGLFLRIVNPTFGSPVLYVIGDEAPNYMDALYMIAQKSISVDNTIYPPFGAFFQIPFLLLAFVGTLAWGKVHSIAELTLFLLTNQGYFLFIPRLLAGFFGSVTILVLYAITRKLFFEKKQIALISSLLFALSVTHVQVSHFGRPWSAALFFFALSALFSIFSVQSDSHEKRNSIAASICTIISFGFHQVGILGLWLFILIRIIGKKRKRFISLLSDGPTLFGVLFSSVGIVVVYFINSFGPAQGFFRDTYFYDQSYSIWRKIIDIVVNNNLLYHFKEMLINEPVVVLFFILALLAKGIYRKPLYALIIFIPSTFFFVGFSMPQPRYMLPALLLMFPFAAFGIDFFLEFLKTPRKKAFVLAIILLFASYDSFMWNYIYTQEPTFIQAKNWIESTIPPEKIILTTSLKFTPFAPAKDVLPVQQGKYPGFYKAAGDLLEIGQYPQNVRNIIYLDKLANINQKEIVPQLLETLPVPYDYILDMYWDPADSRLLYVDKKKLAKIQSFWPTYNTSQQPVISQILATTNIPLPLLLFSLHRAGPYVDIYQRINE